MRQVVCKSCGRRYDYDKENFCPKCGGFNQPEGAPSTRLERDQLARFDGGRDRTPRREAPARTQPAPQRPPAYRETPPASARRSRQTAGPEAPGQKRRPGLAVLVAIMAISALSAIPLNLRDSSSRSLDSAWEDLIAGRTGDPVWSEQECALEEPFSLNSVEVTVDDVWWVDLSGNPRAARADCRCLAVEVWITGGTRQDGLRIEDPALVLADGTSVSPEDDSSLHQKLAANGLYPVNLRDYQWEDPLYGQFVFYLPQDAAGQAELVFSEYGTSGAPQGTRTVSFALPEGA